MWDMEKQLEAVMRFFYFSFFLFLQSAPDIVYLFDRCTFPFWHHESRRLTRLESSATCSRRDAKLHTQNGRSFGPLPDLGTVQEQNRSGLPWRMPVDVVRRASSDYLTATVLC